MQLNPRVKALRAGRRQNRAQTILEYFLILIVFVAPVATVIREAILEDSRSGKKDNVMRNIVSDSYGNETRFGVIGRPYP